MGATLEKLWATARTLRAETGAASPLPPLFFVTDPARVADPVAVAERLPPGAGVIFRAFGAPDAAEVGRRLARTARARRLTLLVGLDADLARAIGADGVHLPRRALSEAPALRAAGVRILTGAVHDAQAAAAARAAGLDAVLISPVFASRSPSAGEPLGPEGFETLARAAGAAAYALGGVDAATAPRLAGRGAAGLAAVDAFVND